MQYTHISDIKNEKHNGITKYEIRMEIEKQKHQIRN